LSLQASTAKAAYTKMEADNAAMAEQLARLRQQSSGSSAQCAGVSVGLEAAQLRISELEAENEDLEQQVQRLQEQSGAISMDQDFRVSQAEDSVDEQRQRNAQLEKELRQVRSQLSAIEDTSMLMVQRTVTTVSTTDADALLRQRLAEIEKEFQLKAQELVSLQQSHSAALEQAAKRERELQRELDDAR
jgi:chromosome segregation ATPase